MTQKVFDTDSKEDMALLWSILPDDVKRLKKNEPNTAYSVYVYSDLSCFITQMLKINWHDKTEITRPIQEATEADIGKLCVFWDSDNSLVCYGILQSIGSEAYRLQNKYPYSECYRHCRRLTKQEIEELC